DNGAEDGVLVVALDPHGGLVSLLHNRLEGGQEFRVLGELGGCGRGERGQQDGDGEEARGHRSRLQQGSGGEGAWNAARALARGRGKGRIRVGKGDTVTATVPFTRLRFNRGP